MNVKVDVNLSKLGRLVQSAKDGHYYLDVTDLINIYGYVSAKTGDKHVSMSVYERRQENQYGITHSVQFYNNTTKTKTYCNDIYIKKLSFGDECQVNPGEQNGVATAPDDIF